MNQGNINNKALSDTQPLKIEAHFGDIAQLSVDAIVNAANEHLLPGSGVCGAIHRAAGIKLRQECAKIGFCETGQSVITLGYNLPNIRFNHRAQLMRVFFFCSARAPVGV